MKKTWPISKFDSILRHRKEFFRIDDLAAYKRARVQLHWKGIVLRDAVVGAEIKTKEQQAARAGELLVAEIDAKVGGVGIVPTELEGAIVSSHYFLFEIDKTRCLRGWLDHFIRWGALEEQLVARGSTNYAAIRPQHVLSCEIPLPPLDEQRRIVASIEELSAKIEEARALRSELSSESNVVMRSALTSLFSSQAAKPGWSLRPLNEAATIARGKFAYRPRNEPRFYNGSIPFIQIGDISNSRQYIRHFSQTLNEDGLRISRRFPAGTVVIAITGATIGVTGILTFSSCFPDSIVGVEPRLHAMSPEFLYWSVEYSKHIALLEATQTTQPNINLKHLEKLRIASPPLSEQRRVVTYLQQLQTKVDLLKGHQEETSKELDALMPSILSKAFSGES